MPRPLPLTAAIFVLSLACASTMIFLVPRRDVVVSEELIEQAEEEEIGDVVRSAVPPPLPALSAGERSELVRSDDSGRGRGTHSAKNNLRRRQLRSELACPAPHPNPLLAKQAV